MKRGKCESCGGPGEIAQNPNGEFSPNEIRLIDAALERALKSGRLRGRQGKQEVMTCCGKVWVQEKITPKDPKASWGGKVE